MNRTKGSKVDKESAVFFLASWDRTGAAGPWDQCQLGIILCAAEGLWIQFKN